MWEGNDVDLTNPVPCPVCATDLNVYSKPHCKICKEGRPGWRLCSASTSKGFFRQLCGTVVDPRSGRYFRFRIETKEEDVEPGPGG